MVSSCGFTYMLMWLGVIFKFFLGRMWYILCIVMGTIGSLVVRVMKKVFVWKGCTFLLIV